MDVFISWSGRRSQALATFLRDWLPQVIQALAPFVSTTIEKGRKWNAEIADKLASAPIGVVCLTRDSLRSPWLLFESGALSKPRDGYVCTFLLDLEPADIESPLADFQHTRADKADVYRLLQTINGVLDQRGEKRLPDAVLERSFERCWPELQLAIENARTERGGEGRPVRSDRQVLDEVLMLVRGLVRDDSEPYGQEFEAELVAELANSQIRNAFVYTIQVPAADRERVAPAIDRIKQIDGCVTARHAVEGTHGLEIECVFLRPAESEVVAALSATNIKVPVTPVRSVSFTPQTDALPNIAHRLRRTTPPNKRLHPTAPGAMIRRRG